MRFYELMRQEKRILIWFMQIQFSQSLTSFRVSVFLQFPIYSSRQLRSFVQTEPEWNLVFQSFLSAASCSSLRQVLHQQKDGSRLGMLGAVKKTVKGWVVSNRGEYAWRVNKCPEIRVYKKLQTRRVMINCVTHFPWMKLKMCRHYARKHWWFWVVIY
jgi:hypothetical protein